MELRVPKRKRRVNVTPQSPFPVPVESITGVPSNLALWKVCTGKYNGDCVVVSDSEDIFKLHYQGFYGKGSLSRSYPDFGKTVKGIPPFIRQRQWDLRCSWGGLKNIDDHQNSTTTLNVGDDAGKSIECSKSLSDSNIEIDNSISSCKQSEEIGHSKGEANSAVSNKFNEEHEAENISLAQQLLISSVRKPMSKTPENDIANQDVLSPNQTHQEEKAMVVVLPDSDDDEEHYLANIKPELKTEPFSLHESLHLTLEESFFLSYALGCLQVLDLFGENQSLTNMWQLFCDSQNDFVQSYVAYHYFRAKNWVVKPGVKFGGDFLLYKQGPPFYHASYVVIVEVIDGKTFNRVVKPGSQALSWTRLMGLHRLAETAAKEILLCQVVWPANLPENALRSPTVLAHFTVHETLLRRWVSSKERELEDL